MREGLSAVKNIGVGIKEVVGSRDGFISQRRVGASCGADGGDERRGCGGVDGGCAAVRGGEEGASGAG